MTVLYGYVYRTHNKVNGKMYIGQHKADHIDNSYLGSSPILKKAINKYGKENFEIEILEWCENKDILNEKEIYWIKHYNAINNKSYYNLKDGGSGGFDYINKNNLSPSRNHGTHPMLGLTGENNPLFGIKRSQSTKDKISKVRKNTIAINNGKISKYIPSDMKVPDGWQKGLIKESSWTDIRKQNQKETITGRKFVHNGFENKLVKPELVDYYVNLGYVLGRLPNNNVAPMKNKKHSESTKQRMSNSRKNNYLWINNGEINKRVKPNELNKYLSNNWVRGRIKRV